MAIMRTLLPLVIVYLVLSLLNTIESSDIAIDESAHDLQGPNDGESLTALYDPHLLELTDYDKVEDLRHKNPNAKKIGMTEVFKEGMLNPIKVHLWADPDELCPPSGDEPADDCNNDAWIYIDLQGIDGTMSDRRDEIDEKLQKHSDEIKQGIEKSLKIQLSEIQNNADHRYSDLFDRLKRLDDGNRYNQQLLDALQQHEEGDIASQDARNQKIETIRQRLQEKKEGHAAEARIILHDRINPEYPEVTMDYIHGLKEKQSSDIDRATRAIRDMEEDQSHREDILQRLKDLGAAQRRNAELEQALSGMEEASDAQQTDLASLRGSEAALRAQVGSLRDELPQQRADLQHGFDELAEKTEALQRDHDDLEAAELDTARARLREATKRAHQALQRTDWINDQRT